MKQVTEQCETKKPVYGGITELEDLRLNLEENAVPEAMLLEQPL